MFYYIGQKLFCIKSAQGRADNENSGGDISIQIIFLGVKFETISQSIT